MAIRGSTRTVTTMVGLTLLFAGCSSKLESAVQRDIDIQLESQKRSITRCYAKALKRNNSLKGQMTLTFQVTEDGEFRQVNVIQNDHSLADPRLQQCVLSRTSRLSLPNNPDRPVVVTYPLTFQVAARR